MIFRSLIALLGTFSFLAMMAEGSANTSSDSTESTVNSACSSAITSYNDAKNSLNNVCKTWEEGGEESLQKLLEAGNRECTTALGSCRLYERSVAERGCLEKLPGNGSPTPEQCKEDLRPNSPNQNCSYISTLSVDELSQLNGTSQDLISELMNQQREARAEAGSFVEDLTKGLQEMQKQEAETRAEIAKLKAQLEQLGPAAQGKVQEAYNSYIENLDKLEFNFEQATQKFKLAQVEKGKAEMQQMQMCQKTASDIFKEQSQQRQGLNAARRNSTSLNNLTGNAQRFDANLKKYLDQCLQSDFYINSMKQIENMYDMAVTEYENAGKRMQRMRQHLEQNFQRFQQQMQETTRLQMKSLVDQMTALEQKIQRLRTQMMAQQAQSELQRQTQSTTLAGIEAQITEARNGIAARTCATACSVHLHPPGLGESFEDLQKILTGYQTTLTQCQNVWSNCVADTAAGRVNPPDECSPTKENQPTMQNVIQ